VQAKFALIPESTSRGTFRAGWPAEIIEKLNNLINAVLVEPKNPGESAEKNLPRLDLQGSHRPMRRICV